MRLRLKRRSVQSETIGGNGVPPEPPPAKSGVGPRIAFWLGVAGVSALVSIFVIRTVMQRAPTDPTTQRIEALIDEANRLLKALEEKG